MTVVKFLPNTLEHKESKMKQVIFNVGGALSSYIEAYGKKILLDIGSSMDFNPIIDFLFPLFNRRYGKSMEKRNIDQLIISHPHYDHLSAIKEFDAHFTATLITCPNDNQPQDKKYKINWELVDNQTDECIKYLKEKDKEEIVEIISKILLELKKFESTFDVGSKIIDGIKVSIIGRPNSNNSSISGIRPNGSLTIIAFASPAFSLTFSISIKKPSGVTSNIIGRTPSMHNCT